MAAPYSAPLTPSDGELGLASWEAADLASVVLPAWDEFLGIAAELDLDGRTRRLGLDGARRLRAPGLVAGQPVLPPDARGGGAGQHRRRGRLVRPPVLGLRPGRAQRGRARRRAAGRRAPTYSRRCTRRGTRSPTSSARPGGAGHRPPAGALGARTAAPDHPGRRRRLRAGRARARPGPGRCPAAVRGPALRGPGGPGRHHRRAGGPLRAHHRQRAASRPRAAGRSPPCPAPGRRWSCPTCPQAGRRWRAARPTCWTPPPAAARCRRCWRDASCGCTTSAGCWRWRRSSRRCPACPAARRCALAVRNVRGLSRLIRRLPGVPG